MNYIDLKELNSYNVEVDEASGDFIHCRRQYSQTGAFSCTGGERIFSSADVAYLMRSLQEFGVEHSFACFVRKDGSPVVLHMGMGSFDACMVNNDVVLYTANRVEAEQVYLVHNHPSGSLVFSNADKMMLKRLEEALDGRMKGSIVINTTSGRYLFTPSSKFTGVVDELPQSVKEEASVQVLEFDRQVFSKEWNYDSSFKIMHSGDVAAFLSSQRFGQRDKGGLLILNKGLQLVANVQLLYSTLTRSKCVALASYMQSCACAFGGSTVVPYFTGDISRMMIRILYAEFRKISSFEMVDLCYNINGKFKSAADEDLLNCNSLTISPKL